MAVESFRGSSCDAIIEGNFREANLRGNSKPKNLSAHNRVDAGSYKLTPCTPHPTCGYFLSAPPPDLRSSPMKLAFTCIIGQISFSPVISFSRRSLRSHDSIFPQFHRGEFQLNYSSLPRTVSLLLPHSVERRKKRRGEGREKGRSRKKEKITFSAGDGAFVICR